MGEPKKVLIISSNIYIYIYLPCSVAQVAQIQFDTPHPLPWNADAKQMVSAPMIATGNLPETNEPIKVDHERISRAKGDIDRVYAWKMLKKKVGYVHESR